MGFTVPRLTIHDLNDSEKKLLLEAITRAKPEQFAYGKVFGDSLQRKRQYNAALSLREKGLAEGEVTPYRTNSEPCSFFGHGYRKASSGCQFDGRLTSVGLVMAMQLKTQEQNH